MSKSSVAKESDIFKALSHPKRREILKFIAQRGSVSYSELTEIEPKLGVLYHHLRLLGDLIYQDKNKLYHLTEKGQKAYEFLETFFLEPSEKSIHTVLTPRPFIERIEGRVYSVVLLVLLILTSYIWALQDDFVPVFLFIAPIVTHYIPPWSIAITTWFLSSLLIVVVIRVAFQHYCSLFDLLVKSSPSFIILNMFPIIVLLVSSETILFVFYFILQLFAILFMVSAVSVAGRINLRKAALSVISLHYISIVVYLIYISIV